MPKWINLSHLLRLLIIPALIITSLIFQVSIADDNQTSAQPSVNLVHEVYYQAGEGLYYMVVEIPAGTVEKWQTTEDKGELYHEIKNGSPRMVEFLPYPGNYGFIPQTHYDKASGGDGDPLDVILLAPSVERGSTPDIKILGALKFLDKGEADDKLIAVDPEGPFSDANDLSELMTLHPGAVEVVKTWFESYKKPGKMMFMGYSNQEEAIQTIEKTHQFWVDRMHTDHDGCEEPKKTEHQCPCKNHPCCKGKKKKHRCAQLKDSSLKTKTSE